MHSVQVSNSLRGTGEFEVEHCAVSIIYSHSSAVLYHQLIMLMSEYCRGYRQVVAVGRSARLHRILSLRSHQFRDASQLVRPRQEPLLCHSMAVHRHRHQIRPRRRYL